MAIWKRQATPEKLQEACRGTMVEHLGIQFIEIGEDYLSARMPVDHRTVQPYGLLHGGASAALAETLGSFGCLLCLPEGSRCVGLEINANHLRAMRDGEVIGTARPVHAGRTTHVWEIRVENSAGKLVSTSRLTLLVLGAGEE